MHAGDVHLEAVWIDRPAVICSTTVAAKGSRERIVYTLALEGSSYVIKFGGESEGSKLFPYQLEVRPINMDMPPGCSGPIATRPQRCFDTTTQAGGPSAVLTIIAAMPVGGADLQTRSRRDRARFPRPRGTLF